MILSVENITKCFDTGAGERLEVLRDVSLRLESGARIAVVGPSGSGKSTLLGILGTLEPPSEGRVLFDETDPSTLSEPALAALRRERIGFVFQDHHLLPQCSAVQNVLVPILADRKAGPEDVERAEGLLEKVGLGERLDHRPGQLSGGERQRVAIARAMIRGPGLLLADEPTGNLDARRSLEVANLLIEMSKAEQAILVVVTHSQEVAQLLDRQLTLEEGHLE